MTASQFDTNRAKCRILPRKADGFFANAMFEGLRFDPLRRAYCMTASQFDTNQAKCRILPRKAEGFSLGQSWRSLVSTPLGGHIA